MMMKWQEHCEKDVMDGETDRIVLRAAWSQIKSAISSDFTGKWTESRHGIVSTVYPKKYAHGYCFAVLCCGYTLTDFPISIRLTLLALWQSDDCPSASKATLMNMDKYFMWIHYERLHNHNKAKHNKTVCIFLGKWTESRHGPLTRYVKLQVVHAPGMPGTFSPAADFKGNR